MLDIKKIENDFVNVKKGIVAIAIFAFLFIGAWVIHEQTKREYGENQQQFRE